MNIYPVIIGKIYLVFPFIQSIGGDTLEGMQCNLMFDMYLFSSFCKFGGRESQSRISL